MTQLNLFLLSLLYGQSMYGYRDNVSTLEYPLQVEQNLCIYVRVSSV